MTRKDLNFLAEQLRHMLEAGTLQRGGFYWLCAQLDANYRNFNRDKFEAAVLGEKHETS